MNKPISVAIKETRNKIVTAINESGLPMVCIRPILQEITSEVSALEREEIARDTAAYENALKEEEKKEEEKDGEEES